MSDGDRVTADERRLARVWKVVALRGAAGLVLGVVLLAWSGITLSQLAGLVAAFALLDALVALAGAVRVPLLARERAWLAAGGLVSLVTGVAVAASSGISGRTLLYAVAGWAVATGVVEFWAGYALPLADSRSLLLMVAGPSSAFFGATMFAKPGSGALGLLPLLAAYAIVTGLPRLAAAAAMRDLVVGEEPRRPGRPVAHT